MSKSGKSSKKSGGAAGYPQAGYGYPTQQQAPIPQYGMGNPGQPTAGGYAPPAGGYAPPPGGYAPAPGSSMGYPQGGAPQGPPPAYTASPHGHPQLHPQPQPQMYAPTPLSGQTVMVQGGFDAGARFDSTTTANIPPPPPGVMANNMQMASMQGANVVATQRKADWFSGGSGGGYTWGF